jgi:CheY-like chemotaxis protein
MTHEDGHEALAEIKPDPSLRSIPVVVLTTSHAEQDIMSVYDIGAKFLHLQAGLARWTRGADENAELPLVPDCRATAPPRTGCLSGDTNRLYANPLVVNCVHRRSRRRR